MSEMTVRLQLGDVFCVDGHEYALFHIATDIIGAIRMDVVAFENFNTEMFIKNVKEGVYLPVHSLKVASCPDQDEDDLKKMQLRASIMNNLIEDYYPAWAKLAKPGRGNRAVRKYAEACDLCEKHFKRLFYRYLRSGRDIFSLVDVRATRMARKQTAIIPMPTQTVLTERESALLYGLQVFKDRLSVEAAYDYMVTKYYSTLETVVENGVLEQKVVANSDAPSYDTLWRYIKKNLGGLTIKQYIKGEREVRNNDRLLTGNQRSGLITIGQLMQLDECEVAVDLTDSCGHVIGKPVVYCAFDPAAQIIIGLYVGFINNAFGGVVNLFLSMMEPHENQTSQVGVHCDAYSFPSMVLPRQVYCDQGSEYMSGMMEKAMLELGVTVSPVPAAAGSYKGGVENVFHRLQSRLKKQLINDGYILETHEGPELARENAVLTTDDFKAICYRIVIELNTTSLGEMFSPDMDIIEHGIPPVPAEIWKHKMKTCFDPVMITDKNRLQKMFCLLWRDKAFDRDRAGLTYKGHNLRYFSDEEWFTTMLRLKNADLDIRYNETDTSQIFVRYKDVIHVVPLATARDELRSFSGMSWRAYDEAYSNYLKLRKQQREKDLSTHLTTVYRNDQTLAAAKAAHEGIVNDKKSIPEARAVERLRTETSEGETRNRILGVEPVKLTVPEKPEPKVVEKYEPKSMDQLLAMLEDEE